MKRMFQHKNKYLLNGYTIKTKYYILADYSFP